MFKFLNDTYQVVISYSKLFDATGITCSPTKYHRLCLIYSIKKRCNSIAQFEKKNVYYLQRRLESYSDSHKKFKR